MKISELFAAVALSFAATALAGQCSDNSFCSGDGTRDRLVLECTSGSCYRKAGQPCHFVGIAGSQGVVCPK
ncbi:hypothetical protein Cob_v008803 [Colletotrichum orbiculare MAFF 240422]|uniref:Uncharacterized protein n=1 Tax=Colletotrichum orbiculare (strain 104-T / ATCC 96160 / CBS 514.97 / LARS 414 / MAFF 240422) TaxID=1213857 RepID=A0A484FK66_COLOR|nr:hypothetical protein Cob_v008803 [Colletotrichum orbiculare MAFF 240422]